MERISGVYRLYIEKEGQQYSYVGLSVDIHKRKLVHLRKIKSFFNGDDLIKNVVLQIRRCIFYGRFLLFAKDALYWKISFFCWLYDLDVKDIKFEILDRMDVIDKFKDQMWEMHFIEKYNSERLGFNGPYAKDFLYKNYYESASLKNKQLIKILKSGQEAINNKTHSDILSCEKVSEYEQYFMVWIGSQMGIKRFDNVFLRKCRVVLRKLELKGYINDK